LHQKEMTLRSALCQHRRVGTRIPGTLCDATVLDLVMRGHVSNPLPERSAQLVWAAKPGQATVWLEPFVDMWHMVYNICHGMLQGEASRSPRDALPVWSASEVAANEHELMARTGYALLEPASTAHRTTKRAQNTVPLQVARVSGRRRGRL